jgi:hypothetical protein
LGPLDRDPVIKTLRPLAGQGTPNRVVVYGRDGELSALVTASGLQPISGLTPYPDSAWWQRVDPSQESAWNNYAKYTWVADEHATGITLQSISGTQQALLINPCSAELRTLEVGYAVSPEPLDFGCLRLINTVNRPDGKVAYIYRQG